MPFTMLFKHAYHENNILRFWTQVLKRLYQVYTFANSHWICITQWSSYAALHAEKPFWSSHTYAKIPCSHRKLSVSALQKRARNWFDHISTTSRKLFVRGYDSTNLMMATDFVCLEKNRWKLEKQKWGDQGPSVSTVQRWHPQNYTRLGWILCRLQGGFWRCLTAYIEGSASLKGLHDGPGVADAKVKGLLFDVESFAQVL
jgi:hypothetical protein